MNKWCRKPISQYDKNGIFIKTFESAMQAERELNIKHSNISNVLLNKRKTAGGYIFKYN